MTELKDSIEIFVSRLNQAEEESVNLKTDHLKLSSQRSKKKKKNEEVWRKHMWIIGHHQEKEIYELLESQKKRGRYHLLESLLSKRQEISVGEELEKRKHLWTVGGNVTWYSHYEK